MIHAGKRTKALNRKNQKQKTSYHDPTSVELAKHEYKKNSQKIEVPDKDKYLKGYYFSDRRQICHNDNQLFASTAKMKSTLDKTS